MKIAFFADTYYPHLNGVTTSVEAQAMALRKLSHTVYIFAPAIRGYKDKDSYVIRLPSVHLLPTLPEAVRAPLPFPNYNFRQIYRLKFDLIHAHGNGAFSLIGYQIARLRKIPYILTFHTLFTRYTHYVLYGKVIRPSMAGKILKMFGNLCEEVIAPSQKMKEELTRFGINKKVHIIPNFIDRERFKKMGKGYLHKKYKIPKDYPILLSVGRLGREKKFEFLMDVFKKLIEDDIKTQLIIVGYGREKKRLMHYAKSLRIDKRTHFTGKIEQAKMPLVYSDADIFVFASDTETQGISVLEAASCGLPLILAKDGAYRHMIKEKVNGYLLPCVEKDFVEAIKTLLKNKILYKKFSVNSQKMVEKYFGEKTITKKLLSLYEELVRANKKRKMGKKRFLKTAVTKILHSYRYLYHSALILRILVYTFVAIKKGSLA